MSSDMAFGPTKPMLTQSHLGTLSAPALSIPPNVESPPYLESRGFCGAIVTKVACACFYATLLLSLPLSSMDVDSPMLPYSEPPLSPSGSASSGTVEAADDLDNQNHESHVNCPDSLDCLPDTSGRPQHTLPVILRCAILGSPRQRLTIREIYAAMENKYMYYKTAGSTWKVSCLSIYFPFQLAKEVSSNLCATIYPSTAYLNANRGQ